MDNQPYIEVNRALSQPFMVGLLPAGLIGPVILCLFLSYLLTQTLWAILFAPPSYFWTMGLFFWLTATYYAVVGNQPWRVKNQIAYIPRYRRGMYTVAPLLKIDHD